MNEHLLEDALTLPNIHVFFKHKVLSEDFDGKVLAVHDDEKKGDIHVHFDFCVGADGSNSIVRRQLMRVVRCVILIFSSFMSTSKNPAAY